MSKDKYDRSLKNLNMLRRPVLNNVTNTTESTFGKVLRQAKSRLQNSRTNNLPQGTANSYSNTKPAPLRDDIMVPEDKENYNPLTKIDEREELDSNLVHNHKSLGTQKHVTIDERQEIIGYSHLDTEKSAPSSSTYSSEHTENDGVHDVNPNVQRSDNEADFKMQTTNAFHENVNDGSDATDDASSGSKSSNECPAVNVGNSLAPMPIDENANNSASSVELRAKQLQVEDSKKRPISTVVEQTLPKKFKVCEKGKEYEWEDLDEEDINDPFMVSEYVTDIFEYLHRLEMMTLPNRHELFKHANIQQNRDILVNWMVKIHNKFGLLPETLYLALNIMDRFLCKELVQLEKLQLVGTACLFIASKYEEVYSPSVKHFAYETDGACDEEEIKEGEKFILKTLEFNLNYPNPMNFLRRISKADDYDIQSRTLAKYLLEISIVDFKFIGILPSLCAAASMFLSRKMLGKGQWDGNLIHYSGGYTKDELAPVCNMVMEYLVQPVVHDELFKKYASRRFMKASVISRQWAKKVMSHNYDIMTLHDSE